MKKFDSIIKRVLSDSVFTTFELLKIMIPISILVKILRESGVIEVIGSGFSPVMGIVGLPGSFGLVWVTAMITNIYGGLLVFFSLSTDFTLSVAQVTILGCMILVAHTLPVEVRIAQKAGVSFWFMLFFRVSCAFFLGIILYYLFTFFNT